MPGRDDPTHGLSLLLVVTGWTTLALWVVAIVTNAFFGVEWQPIVYTVGGGLPVLLFGLKPVIEAMVRNRKDNDASN